MKYLPGAPKRPPVDGAGAGAVDPNNPPVDGAGAVDPNSPVVDGAGANHEKQNDC